jgi:Ser/Thr protein kinase RdoA (MazF antagonist)
MFKLDWERAGASDQARQVPFGLPRQMIAMAYPDKSLASIELMNGGCANLNYKIQLKHENWYMILRIYLRNKEAVFHEQNMAMILKEYLPIPRVDYVGVLDDYRFAVIEFMPGISLRDRLLSERSYDLCAMMKSVAELFLKITKHKFPEIQPESFDLIQFTKSCLQDKTVAAMLDPPSISAIEKALVQHADLIPSNDENCLVHGDFDPSNILVDNVNGSWVISGILDWEFSFSGSYLWDLASMLRYAHELPRFLADYQDGFISGLIDGGMTLPYNWQSSVYLLNLVSLLDLMRRSDPKTQSNRSADILRLIHYFLSQL